jgi:beta-lactam-binding protein with PASTA domain/tRNA A-37 threonylcarbamoyl transferase component Bud32
MSDQGPTVFKERYELHRKLARGGMSDVYLARDQVLDRPVAVKVLFPEYAKDPTFVERFRREAQAAAKLNHPNVVAVYDWGEELGTYFIAMEYVEGRSLSEIIRAEGPLPPRRVAEITADVASALGFAHRNGVVHRDVKPGNVIVETSGQVKVADFGIAQALAGNEQAQLTRAGAVMGTATYFSPEQAQGKQVDQRSDLYSLGCVMYEMLATRPPFQGESPVAIAYKHVQEQPPRLSALGVQVPAPLDAIVMKSLAKEASGRYQSAEELRADLRRFLEGQPVTAAIAGAAIAASGLAAAGAAPDATIAMPATTAIAATGAVRTPPPADDYYAPRRRGSGVFVGLLVLLLIGLGVALFYIGSNLSSKSSKKQVVVPTVVHLPVDVATSQLQNAGFKVNRQDVPNDKEPPGQVYDQDPKGQSTADDGSTVTITVSQPVGDADVPPVTGLPQNTAETQLKAAGFAVVINQEADEKIEKGLVISQSPNAGTKAPKGSNVTIIVSTGKNSIEIPDVAGESVDRAIADLLKAGFKSTSQKNEFSPDVPKGKVIKTEPGAGSKADPESTTVLIVISNGPETTTTTAPPATTTTTKPPATTTTKPPATSTTVAPTTTSTPPTTVAP